MVQVEGRPLGADSRQRVEVVPRRRARGRPLQGGTEAPGVVDLDLLGADMGEDHVEQEGQGRSAHDEGTDRRDLVQPVEVVLREIVHVPARCSDHPEPVLDQEGHVETDGQQPEMDLADALGELVAEHLRPPEIEAREHPEHDRPGHDVVEDRKSTRLNSSHVAITYAVLCLKKKINKTKTNQLNIYSYTNFIIKETFVLLEI